jgi:hypothetical protein
LLAAVLVAAAWCRASDVMPPAAGQKTAGVIETLPIGIWISSIGKFNFPDDSFRATFWLSAVLPKGQENLLTRLDFVNADTFGILNSTTVPEARGSVTYQKVTGTFGNEWKLKNYPFDHHTLRICIDACEKMESLRLTADKGASGYDPDINRRGVNDPEGANGWKVTGFRILSSSANTPQTSGRNPGSPVSCSTVMAEIDVRRCSYAIFWKMTAAAFASIILVIITYFLPIEGPENMSPYFATFVGAVFAIVINLKSANAELGSSSGITLIDKIHLEALAYVLLGAFVTLLGRLRIAAGIPAASVNRDRALIALISLLGMTALISRQVYLAVVNG